VLELLGLLNGHGLNRDSPRWVLTLLDLFEELLVVNVWVLSSQLDSFFLSVEVSSLVGTDVDLNVLPLSLVVDELESVTRVSVLKIVSLWDTTVSHENHDLMNGFWVLRQVIPEHVVVLQVGLRITLLSVNEVWELGWVTKEEDWSVVEDPVEVTFLSSHLDRESTRITSSVWRSRFPTNSRETHGQRSLLSWGEELCAREVGNVMSGLEDTMSSSSLCVYDSFWNSLSVEVSEKVNVVEVLQ